MRDMGFFTVFIS